MEDVTIRRGTIEDSEAFAYLMADLGYPTTSEEMRERLTYLLQDPAYVCFAACHSHEVIGMIGLMKNYFFERNGTYIQILLLTVSEHYRGNGIGKALVEYAEEWAIGQGCTAVVLQIGKQQHALHSFYRNINYDDTGLRFIKVLLS
ncbi:N-acetyltransferase GCN5 [Fictibacillus macauensis ZFHKF-1]|uniref:N-acetyltransferase GCN5 n=1 Tax=Fictibacillus macauensis ZFHKF-1 TaxID=1196324 RepID=I8AJA2_9BACL|nr:GNAT family N-acetyltransferase [Fictibacillus macauensis]EIT85867.1 N-acetyltransferase GCN5 [Fictibacillus macauensis ZFHKF-1]